MIFLGLCATRFDDVGNFLLNFFRDAGRAQIYTLTEEMYSSAARICLEYLCGRSIEFIDFRTVPNLPFLTSSNPIMDRREAYHYLTPLLERSSRMPELISLIKSGKFERMVTKDHVNWTLMEQPAIPGVMEVSEITLIQPTSC